MFHDIIHTFHKYNKKISVLYFRRVETRERSRRNFTDTKRLNEKALKLSIPWWSVISKEIH